MMYGMAAAYGMPGQAPAGLAGQAPMQMPAHMTGAPMTQGHPVSSSEVLPPELFFCQPLCHIVVTMYILNRCFPPSLPLPHTPHWLSVSGNPLVCTPTKY